MPDSAGLTIGIDASRANAAQRTGTEAYAFHLIRALVPLAAARGHRLRLYFNQPPSDAFKQWRQWIAPDQATAVTPDTCRLVTIPFLRLWTHVRLAATLQQDRPDVFFTPAHVIPWLYRGAAVATVHDLGYHFFPIAHTRPQLAYLRWSTRHNARRSRIVLADSHATKDDLSALYGIAAAKIRVVYPGRDPALRAETSPHRQAAVQRKYGIRAPYFLYLSTLQPRKNVVRLIEAFAEIADTLPQQLVLAGKAGWLAQPILDAVAQLPMAVAQRVILPGFIAEDDKAALLSGATALLYPSLYEGFGFPVIEAQACGTAVLCADSSSLPEVAGDGALLVDPGHVAALADGMQRLAHDGALREALIAAGTVNVQRFSWRDSAESVLTALEDAARG
jgi:glycosyltransferase involved in cell wall biosynthesis